jgi:tetratricopeptide (TPR) repeat protein
VPKPSPAVRKYREFYKIDDQMMVLVQRAMRLYGQAEDLLVRDLERIRASRDMEMLDQALSRQAHFHLLEGRTFKAEKYLREREKTFPESLEAKLATARYFGYTMRRYDFALRKLRQIRLPKEPKQGDHDTYYSALDLKGISLLYTGQTARAATAMQELADFTRKNLDKLLFFSELAFVEMMIERRLALRACRDYLQTLKLRKQVPHDRKKTVVLLRRVNKLLKA